MRKIQSEPLKYFISFLITLFVVWLRFIAQPLMGSITLYQFLFPTVVLLSSLYGMGPGIFGAVAGVLVTEAWLIQSGIAPDSQWGSLLRVIMLVLTAGYCGYLAAKLRRSQSEADQRLLEAERERSIIATIFDSFPVGIFIKDTRTHAVRSNPLSHAIWGRKLPLSDLSEAPIEYKGWDAATGQAVTLDEGPLNAAISDGKTVSGIYNIERCDGKPAVIYLTAAPIRDPAAHSIVGSVACILDITQQQVMEKELRASEERYRTLFTNMTEGFAVGELCNGPNGKEDVRFIEANEVCEQQTGLKLSESLGRPFTEVLPHAEPIWINTYRRVAETGEAVRLNHYNQDTDRYYDLLCFSPTPGKFAITFYDVTSREKTKQALMAAEAKFRALYDTNIIGIVTADENYIYDANDYYLNMLGYTREELNQGKINWREMTPPEHLSADFKCLEALKKYGTYPAYEKEYFRRDGSRVTVLLGDALINRQENLIIAYVLDISKQKAAEAALEEAKMQAEAANQAKSLFLANMSHEIRSPLNALMGFSNILARENLSPQEREDFAGRIERNGLLLAQLIDDILDLSKIEAGRLQIEKTEVDLPQLIEDVEAVMRHKASEKAIHFAMNAVDPLPESAKTDPMRLKQILTNIIGNAVKFTNHGKVEVKIYIDQTDCKLRVFVSDTGIGITQEQKNRLFKPFAQADPLITRQFGGTGLGLLLSRHLAQALGGDVRLASSWPSQGSTFEVTVGLEETQYKVRPLETLKVSKGIGNSLSGLRILLAEDIPDNQLLVKRILKNAGAAVEIAADGVEAIEKASRHTYDVILMDIGMPRLDGCEATEELRRRGYKAPIIAVTAYAMKEEVDRFLASGCNGHLAKPIAMETLVQVIRRAVCA